MQRVMIVIALGMAGSKEVERYSNILELKLCDDRSMTVEICGVCEEIRGVNSSVFYVT